MGHVDFVKEIIRLKPVFAREVNQEGFSPMHIAADNGQVEIVEGANGSRHQTLPVRGKTENDSFFTTLLSEGGLRNNRFEAIKKVVDWIRENETRKYLLNMKDEQGNTVLHLWKLEKTTSGSLEVNAINHTGITALDVILLFPSEAGDREIAEILRSAGAMRARDTVPLLLPTAKPLPTTSTPERCWSNRDNLVEYFKFKKDRDSPSEARGTLLVIAVLVATATFQVESALQEVFGKIQAYLTKKILPAVTLHTLQLTTTILSSTMSALARSVRPLTRMLRKSFKDFTHRVV
ncbi:hypothetical protein H0E87_022062 [Populus deltoides]|uniref:PGG domain-containing protein n=1 Tax=Populus deltoides TaxID=3696 RepID=A0A8T2XK02_POPDE|nr:hypothetical protein H0E87_022062 [Populus deltoides]